ncbi:transglycosylase domain-containing protein [Pullulanibacillus sp. KACC 23026]|uniref:transglycosylase domain-containing protein n=1 Tax=Pullulanibacillus sp. KACC 23026 TaxID=3028315 RepID=UPI0023AFDC17|nr:transglycosylase domain-containing protein [Pullulanibacillus sp. KACC 23026]WEG13871.1 transglycosylase domain-containing protein [Pullulanibacillus sp. KACC 23026]
MSFKPSDLLAKLNKGIAWLEQKKVLKSFRVSGKVIWNLFLILISLGFISIFFFGGVAAGYFASLVHKQPILSYADMKKDINNYSETSTVYFDGNIQLGKLKTDLLRTPVQLKDVSSNYIDALLATEDELFYQHQGVVPKSVIRATFQELTNQPIVTGGSTITQQLVKNQILTNEVSFDRKAKEILLALRLDRFFSKNEILDAYINVIPFGRNAAGQNIAGVQTAAKGIFGVDAKDLNLPQAAFIAGIPKNPFAYTPFLNGGGVKSDISAGVNRAHDVLKNMLNAGYINQDQYNQAINYDYEKHFVKKTDPVVSKYPYLMPEVRSEAAKQLAIVNANNQGYNGTTLSNDYDTLSKLKTLNSYPAYSKLTIQEICKKQGVDYTTLKKNSDLYQEFYDNAGKQLDQNGYKIYTTINKQIYDKMQKTATSYNGYESDKVFTYTDAKTGEKKTLTFPMELGAVLIKNDTGAIVSFVGGRQNKMEFSQINHALDAKRQNGSTMKPLLDYGPAIENGILSPGTILADLPTTYPGNYSPHNYGSEGDGLFHGFETARYALAESHNLPAIQTYWENLQHFQPLNYLQKMGFTNLVYPDNGPLPVAIGGLTLGTTVEQDTNAYATFANDGNFVGAYMIKKIVDKNGKTVYQHKTTSTKVFSPQTSYMVIDMLRDVINKGTAAGLKSLLNFNSDLYGKTGTTQNWDDSWLVAGNPSMTLGVWNGYDQQQVTINGKVHKLELDPYTYHEHNTQIWADLANDAYSVEPSLMAPKQSFSKPSGVVTETFCGLTNGPASSDCKAAGMQSTDLINTKFQPSGKDTAFERGNYVIINGKEYPALSSTPSQFTKSGVLLSESFIKSHLPYIQWNEVSNNPLKNTIQVAEFNADNQSPSKPSSVGYSSGKLTWSKSPSNDVVGYRVYEASNGTNDFKKISEVMSDTLSISVSQSAAAYYVTAVDITGKESAPSDQIMVGEYSPTTTDPTSDNKASEDKGDGTDNGTTASEGNGTTNPSGNDTNSGAVNQTGTDNSNGSGASSQTSTQTSGQSSD